MPNLILVHRGKHREWNSIDWEWVRIWENLKRLVENDGINIRMARIMAVLDDEIAQDTAFWIRAMNATSDTFKSIWDVPEIKIFSALPDTPDNWASTYGRLVTDAIEVIKWKLQMLWWDAPLIIVWGLPPVWWIAKRLWNDSLPEFRKENYRDAVSAMPKWEIYIQKL